MATIRESAEKIKNSIMDQLVTKGTEAAENKAVQLWNEVKPVVIEAGIGILLFRFGYSLVSIPKHNDSNLHIYLHLN